MALSSCKRQRLFTDVTPIPERHFHFRAVGRGFGMYEDTKWHNIISKLKQFWVDIPMLHFDSFCGEF